MKIRIATRKSPLALWQAEHVKQALAVKHPDLVVELVPMTTQGDKILDTKLQKAGGKGLFVKELEKAMLEGRADIAVHSMKDVPAEFPEGLKLAVICERDDARDVFISNKYQQFSDLPDNAKIGTSSLRRQCQVLSLNSKLDILDLRGNVNTRLQKLDDGEYDAIILAAAGMKRLGLSDRIQQYFTVEELMPAAGQGALGIECREDDTEVLDIISSLEHALTKQCLTAERAITKILDGGCHVPLASYCHFHDEQLHVHGLVGLPDGSRIITSSSHGSDPETLGEKVANDLIAQGAKEIIALSSTQL